MDAPSGVHADTQYLIALSEGPDQELAEWTQISHFGSPNGEGMDVIEYGTVDVNADEIAILAETEIQWPVLDREGSYYFSLFADKDAEVNPNNEGPIPEMYWQLDSSLSRR